VVYCVQCGFENKDDAYYCVKCGASLPLTYDGHHHLTDEGFGIGDWSESCLGFRHGGIIIGLMLGVLIIITGISILLGQSIWDLLWPLFLMGIGLLIVLGAIFRRDYRR
jgi:uncharacterized membrane protein YvbJ